MIDTFVLYERGVFAGRHSVEAASELEATLMLEIYLEEEGRSHLEYELDAKETE